MKREKYGSKLKEIEVVSITESIEKMEYIEKSTCLHVC